MVRIDVAPPAPCLHTRKAATLGLGTIEMSAKYLRMPAILLVGAVVTAFLFTMGKFLIGLYIGSSAVASSYGAAGALIVALLWIYYSAQIFLLGAEFTKVYAHHHGSQQQNRAR
jgi:membrane protein